MFIFIIGIRSINKSEKNEASGGEDCGFINSITLKPSKILKSFRLKCFIMQRIIHEK